LPDVSTTVIVIAFAPAASGIEAVHVDVPVALPLSPVAALLHDTAEIPALSVAPPET
jgi:hypothetical protein